MKKCLSCGKSLIGAHPNRKRCPHCVEELRHRPNTSMSSSQIRHARSLIGKMSREDIAKTLGVSVVSLNRAFRGTRLAFHKYCVVNPGLVRQVNAYYEKHGNKKTAAAFGIKPRQVEHIVYRYKSHKPRQIRWTAQQLTEATKMAGLVSPSAQAKYFNRPRAHGGSIRSLWNKRFGFCGGSINGMVHWYAKELCNHKARYLKPIGEDRRGQPVEFRRLILWVDMEKCLKPDAPEFLKSAIGTMADFQRWLWKSDNPRPLILKMIRERELLFRREA